MRAIAFVSRAAALLAAVLLLAAASHAVKREDFKKCDQSGFCTRQRAFAELVATTDYGSPLQLQPGTLAVVDTADAAAVTADVLHTRINQVFALHVDLLRDGVVRARMWEKKFPDARWRGLDEVSLVGPDGKPGGKLERIADFRRLSDPESESASGVYLFELGPASTGDKPSRLALRITSSPLVIELLANGVPVMAINRQGYLNMEHIRAKPGVESQYPDLGDIFGPLGLEEGLKGRLDNGMWEESWKGTHQDTKPRGPMSVGVDITFPTATHLYGLPEHATSFRLRGTHAKGGDNKTQYEDPYRLYNLDVFEYELNEPMALYGSVPFMAAHTKDWTGGALFLNSAEMWIDVDIREPGSGNKVKKLLTKINKGGWLSTVAQYLPESLRSMIGSAATDDVTVPAEDSTDSSDEIGSHHAVTHWIAETGLVDVFLFPGTAGLNPSLLNPKGPANPFRALHAQYARLTGTSVLPPLFSTAYHQCRWNYMDEQDVKTVDAGFDTENIPMDVLWLDIEHTDGKRYFTWDPHKFPNSTGMVDSLSIRGRRMVTIIDPHLKRDDGFSVYKEAMDLGLLVKDRHRNDYDGWCWPGSSSWTDYINPAAREWWSSRFALDKYQGSTLDLFTWNDMNEPSVFNGPEITMHKDAIHHGGWEHRDVHNVYGMLLHQATYDGHHFRTEKELGRRLRPFVLSRAFFVGTQRFGAIWTGDNMANWEHLEAAVPMLLSISTAGIAFSGADVGGFFHNPEADLLVRWFQAGAFQPFFRGHAHLDTKRREPWVFGEPYTSHIRKAIRERYRLLPYIYTLFFESSISGMPIMRSMAHVFPELEETWAMDDQYMLGDAILVNPVTKKDASSWGVYLPPNEIWYDYETMLAVPPPGPGFAESRVHTIPVTLDKIPVFMRGGHLIFRKDRPRRSAAGMARDPYTLVIPLDEEEKASGLLYVDDGVSYDHMDTGRYVLKKFEYDNSVLSSRDVDIERELDAVTKLPYPAPMEENPESQIRIERIYLVGVHRKVKEVNLWMDNVKRPLYFMEHEGSKGSVVLIRDPKIPVGQADWKLEVVDGNKKAAKTKDEL